MRLLLLFALAFQFANSARILGVFPFTSYSHYLLGETLFKELAKKGHELTVITSFPQKEKIKNFRDVTITSLNEMMTAMKESGSLMDFAHQPALVAIVQCFFMGTATAELVLQDESLQNFLQSNETFDLIIQEQFLNEAFFGFMHKYKAPVILVGTTVSSLWTNSIMGNPTPYGYIPNLFVDFSTKMTLMQRTWNAIVSTFQDIIFHLYFLPQQEKIMLKHFPDAPPIKELMHNTALMLLNSHPALGTPVPLLPNTIEVGGFHIEGQKHRTLSDDLKKYLDDAKEGVVYFSMGSAIQSKDLDVETRERILNAFSKLKMKVLWKFEKDDLPGKPANVRIEKWLPQQAILAHPNVKLFITHGGRLSTTESIYYGKPILGIPMFAEQYANIQEAVHQGYGLFISYQTLTEEKLTDALTEILQNPKYLNEAKYRSSALRDLKPSQLDNALHWIEYVLKHKGAPHLRNSAVFLPWYQYLLLDVILVCVATIWITKKLTCALFRMVFCKSKSQKQKVQ